MHQLRAVGRQVARWATGVARAFGFAWRLLRAIPDVARRCRRALRTALAAIVAAVGRGLRWAEVLVRTAIQRTLRLGRATLLVAVVAGALAVVLGGTAFAASRLSAEYGAGQEQENAFTWAGYTASYAGATCQECHLAEPAAQALTHATVSCEGCHGPLVGHPASDGGSASRLVLPDSEPCITCHAIAAGRPPGFPEIVPPEHYRGNECLRCHDPHAVRAVAPPDVTHSLLRLPACTTCHAPDGLKEVPAGHEMVPDEVCLSCHGVPADDD